jgi:hypothetical protein
MKNPKIRRTWVRSPVTRIKEDADKRDYCQICGLFKTDPEACVFCDSDDAHIGGA